MGIVRKFAVALGSMLGLMLFVSVTGFVALQILEQKAGIIVADSMHLQQLVLEVDSRLQLARQAERDFILRTRDTKAEEARTIYASEFAVRIGEASRNVVWLQDMKRSRFDRNVSAKALRRLTELRLAIEDYSDHFLQMVEMDAQGMAKGKVLDRKIGEMDGAYLNLMNLVRQFSLSANDVAHEASEAIAQYSVLVKCLLVVSVIISLLLAFSIMWVLDRTIAKSAIRLNDAATELSLGNLEARADVDSLDEFGQLAGSINSMAERITILVNELEGEASAASDRLADAIDTVSEGFMLYDRNARLLLANRKIKEVVSPAAVFFKPGITASELLRRKAESGVFINAIGREEDWVDERFNQYRNPGAHKEEPLNDGRWMLVKTYRTGRGEVVVIMSDITERKRKDMDLASMTSDLEELVRDRTNVLVKKAMELKKANSRLKELDGLKSAFLSSVSHELRTPLTSLLGFSKIIKRDFQRSFMPLAKEEKTLRLGSRIQSNLDIIGNERLTRLINDVLDLSRIESGQEDWRFTEVDMGDVVRNAMDSSSGLFSSKSGVKLCKRRFEDVPLVHADTDRLHQVIINLLSNSAKFTDNGEVSVDLYVEEQGMVRLTVEDTGRGIDAEAIEHVFDKFQQAHKGDTLMGKPAGTGLGLAICRQIVEYYGGRIWAESTSGYGARFCVALPVAELVDRPLVLVVDDDPSIRDYLSMTLKRAGYGVRTASNGKEALSLASACRPSLISMDILMPGMDGSTTIRKLREDGELASIPVLVVSVVEGCHAMGGDAALLKPVESEAFIEAVHGLLRKEVSSRPMLALRGDSDGNGLEWAAAYSSKVTGCSESEMWKMLGEGFEGMVLVPDKLAGDIDLTRLCDMPRIQVFLLPESDSGKQA